VSPSPGEGRGRWKLETEVVVEPGVVRAGAGSISRWINVDSGDGAQ
jgi:hypothetical protein